MLSPQQGRCFDLTVEIDSNGRLCDVRLEHGELRDTFAAIGRTDDALASAALLGRPAEAAVPELATLIARLLTPASPSAMAP